MSRVFGIIGWPLGHTMSPTLHNWGFDQLKVDAHYEVWPLEPADLPGFIEKVRKQPISGLSVTIPHKQAIMALLDTITPRAAAVGAVNTVYWEDGHLVGENTDVLGVVAPLQALATLPDSALVLGAGGAARAAVAGFLELGIREVAVSNRTMSKGEALAADFNISCVPWRNRMDSPWQLICNTTPLGMSGKNEHLSPWESDRFAPGAVAYDVVYNPLRTRFLAQATQAGCATISGLDMFLHQGLAQFRLWTGLAMDTTAARELLLRALQQ